MIKDVKTPAGCVGFAQKSLFGVLLCVFVSLWLILSKGVKVGESNSGFTVF